MAYIVGYIKALSNLAHIKICNIVIHYVHCQPSQDYHTLTNLKEVLDIY